MVLSSLTLNFTPFILALFNYMISYHNKTILKPPHNLKIYQPRSKPVRYAVHRVGEVFYQLVRNCIVPVNQIKYFKAGPDIFKISERVMASALVFFA